MSAFKGNIKAAITTAQTALSVVVTSNRQAHDQRQYSAYTVCGAIDFLVSVVFVGHVLARMRQCFSIIVIAVDDTGETTEAVVDGNKPEVTE